MLIVHGTSPAIGARAIGGAGHEGQSGTGRCRQGRLPSLQGRSLHRKVSLQGLAPWSGWCRYVPPHSPFTPLTFLAQIPRRSTTAPPSPQRQPRAVRASTSRHRCAVVAVDLASPWAGQVAPCVTTSPLFVSRTSPRIPKNADSGGMSGFASIARRMFFDSDIRFTYSQ